MMRTLLLIVLLTAPPLAGAQDRYTAHFDQLLRSVTVEVCFEGRPPATLHRNARAGTHTVWLRSGGAEYDGGGRSGRLDLRGLGRDACLTWRVDLGAATDSSDYRLAMRPGEAVLSSADLWFWRDDERRPIRLEIDLPEGMSVSAPWRRAANDGGGLVYFPARTPASWSSRVAVGRFPTERIGVGGRSLHLALVGPFPEARRPEFRAWVEETAAGVASVHGSFPQAEPQILLVAVGPQREAVPWAHVIRGGGVAVEFFVDQTRSIDEFRGDWTATHELSHLLLPLVSSRDRWFSEGLASYYQNVLRARDGRLTEQQAWRKLEAGFERGRRATRGGTLDRATRAGWGATMRVYWSGAAMMLMADSQLRSLSGGRQSLDSALGAFNDCCMAEIRSWRARELMQELDRLTGHEVFMALYRAHVRGEEFPDVVPTYQRLGILPEGGAIVLDSGAPWSGIRHSIMSGAVPTPEYGISGGP
jgi:hypothetical protein